MLALKFIVRDEGRFVMTNLDLRLYYSKVHNRACGFVQPINKAIRPGLKPPTFISPRNVQGITKLIVSKERVSILSSVLWNSAAREMESFDS